MKESEQTTFCLLHRVCYGDTDAGGVVYNGDYLRFFEMARNEMCRARGILLPEFIRDGVAFAVREAQVRYHLPALFDDLLRIEVTCRRDRASSILFDYKVTVQERDGHPHLHPDTAVVTGSTQVVCCRVGLDGRSMRPIRIPKAFTALF
ncbi:MAG: YbgC/FadM family acyl-CoA thioesterase [Verrucomicrobiota bacterium]|jgi:acyl-CoA thioester hydrolase|nr:YbgC/FadM family acyl-CoA thioesterase [Verrucomicrobiota bacterium]MDD8051316.1 YbgC/FadM family acyl-CoA thioesterase [Verrucomicrobiota bacterium]MDI9384657.1 YbgC/FadM family acyl-CoA thioesterase [Verrucomicrobiota bacterium]